MGRGLQAGPAEDAARGRPGVLGRASKGQETTVRSAGVERRRVGPEDGVPFREGRQVRGAWGEGGHPPGGTAA